MTIISRSPKDTIHFAQKIAATLRGGETLALIGELGSGKTTFVKALAKALGVKKPVRSPTFVLMVPYQCRMYRKTKELTRRVIPSEPKASRGISLIRWLLHVDAYRVKNANDLDAIGIRECLGAPNTVTVIEWADHVKTLLPKNAIPVTFFYGRKPNERVIALTKSA